MEPSARPSDLIPTAAGGAAASLLIAVLTFSHLLVPLLAGLGAVILVDMAILGALGLSRLAVRRQRR